MSTKPQAKTNETPRHWEKKVPKPKYDVVTGTQPGTVVTNTLGVSSRAIGLQFTHGNYIRHMTMHSPIGETRLENDDWVISNHSEIIQLQARKINPYLADYKRELSFYMTCLAAEFTDGMEIRDSQIEYEGTKTGDRSALRSEAKAKSKANWADIKAKNNGDDASVGPEPRDHWKLFLLEEHKKKEDYFTYVMKQAWVEKTATDQLGDPPQYETLKGNPPNTYPQVALPGLSGMSPDSLIDHIIGMISNCGTVATVPLSPAAPLADPKDLVSAVPGVKQRLEKEFAAITLAAASKPKDRPKPKKGKGGKGNSTSNPFTVPTPKPVSGPVGSKKSG